MEINITQFYNTANPPDYSASVAELGDNVGQITWQAAKEVAAWTDYVLLEAMRKWAISSGGWAAKEVAAWTDCEVNALFVQLISGDIREKGAGSWEEYQEASEAGQVSGALFLGTDGGIYYILEG